MKLYICRFTCARKSTLNLLSYLNWPGLVPRPKEEEEKGLGFSCSCMHLITVEFHHLHILYIDILLLILSITLSDEYKAGIILCTCC